jgi:hypothetical protein
MYAQIKTALFSNSKILLRSTVNASSRHSSYPEMLVPHPHISHLKCLCHSLRSNTHCDFELGIQSSNHININLGISWKQHVRKHVMTYNCSVSVVSRSFHHTSENYEKEKKPLPKLLYVQNPITWLVIKLDFRMLKQTWDPQFDEYEFRRGTVQVCGGDQTFCRILSLTPFVTSHKFQFFIKACHAFLSPPLCILCTKCLKLLNFGEIMHICL